MAILPGAPGISCTIQVNGEDLPEYDDDDAEEQPAHTATTTRYIEAVTGANFEIATRFSRTFAQRKEGVGIWFYMDGQRIRSIDYKSHEITNGKPRNMAKASAMEGGREGVKRFKFAELKISEGQPDKQLLKKVAKLGIIEIRYYRVRYGPRIKTSTTRVARDHAKTKPLLDDDTVAEKTLKGQAISHQAKLGEFEAIRPIKHSGFSQKCIYLQDEPIATFCFKYRSTAALQSLGVIPRAASPVPLEQREVDDLSPEEMRELIKRQRAQQTHEPKEVKLKAELKRERTTVEEDTDEGAVEVVEQPRKKRRGTEVIDLCDI
ncbi:hypothetical protein LTR08_006774 [Meristemomyces frigidus]|nr:hypothetical protein LTR08_006774 [Meristemomyces frigidus]